MAKFTLTTDERRVITTWLFEGSDTPGYLDSECATCGITPRSELDKDPALEVEQFCRDHKKHGWNLTVGGDTDRYDLGGLECGMVWWIREKDGVEVAVADLPPERADWIAYLKDWDASIDRGKARVTKAERDKKSISCVDSDGDDDGTIRSGDHLDLQASIISKALNVLEQ